jgi:Vitamin K-dependent gamma-carboxylase
MRLTSVRKSSPVLRWGHAKVVELFGTDLRSLAALRIVLAVLVLADLAGRVTDISAHYTDEGVLPRSVLLEDVLSQWSFSLSLMNGEPFFQALLFGVAVLAALALLVGYHTRLATIVLWVVLLSIQLRNPLILNNGDRLLRMLLFWGMFLPLGAHWSVDRALKVARSELSMRFLSLATVGLLMQIAFVYWFTALEKSGRDWRVDGTALYYALSNDQWATPIGSYLLYHLPPLLLEVLTFATITLEAFGAFLLFCPVLTGPVRTGAILAFMSLQLGIWFMMDIGLFSLVSAFCMVCFLPSWFWDKAIPKLRTAFPERPSIARRLQYAVVRSINTSWSSLKSWLSATADTAQTSLRDIAAGDSQEKSHTAHTGTASTIEAQGRSEVQPTARVAAEQERQHGAAARSEPMLRSTLATNLLAGFFLLYVFCWNLISVSSFTMPERAVPLGTFLGLRQSWGVFAPNPPKDSGWYVIPGTLRDGQQVDLVTAVTHNDFSQGEGVSWEKPQDVAGTYGSKYWRNYLGDIREEEGADQRRHFGNYICRQWNARHSDAEQLTELQIVYMKETTLPDYQRAAPEKVVLRKHSCS